MALNLRVMQKEQCTYVGQYIVWNHFRYQLINDCLLEVDELRLVWLFETRLSSEECET